MVSKVELFNPALLVKINGAKSFVNLSILINSVQKGGVFPMTLKRVGIPLNKIY